MPEPQHKQKCAHLPVLLARVERQRPLLGSSSVLLFFFFSYSLFSLFPDLLKVHHRHEKKAPPRGGGSEKIQPESVGFRQNGCSTPRISAPPPLELFLPPLEGWSKKLNSSSLPGQFRSTFSTQPSLAISNKLACQQRAGSIYSFRCHPRNNVF